MANLKVNNYDNLYSRLNGDEYWDFYVNKDSYGSFRIPNGLYDDCLISYIDLCDTECTDGSEWLYSKADILGINHYQSVIPYIILHILELITDCSSLGKTESQIRISSSYFRAIS